MITFNSLTESEIRLRLNHQYTQIPHFKNNKHKKASVLIPLVQVKAQWHVLFIRRAESQHDRHSGQVAFVGGKAEDSDDSVVATALRETHEEIGIHPNDVNVLGRLNTHHTLSGFEISPIVATLQWPYPLTLEKNEVSHTFTLPLDWLADKNNHETKPFKRPDTGENVSVIYFKEHQSELLWGITAKITLTLIDALKNG